MSFCSGGVSLLVCVCANKQAKLSLFVQRPEEGTDENVSVLGEPPVTVLSVPSFTVMTSVDCSAQI